jgi:hypothetical protein
MVMDETIARYLASIPPLQRGDRDRQRRRLANLRSPDRNHTWGKDYERDFDKVSFSSFITGQPIPKPFRISPEDYRAEQEYQARLQLRQAISRSSSPRTFVGRSDISDVLVARDPESTARVGRPTAFQLEALRKRGGGKRRRTRKAKSTRKSKATKSRRVRRHK